MIRFKPELKLIFHTEIVNRVELLNLLNSFRVCQDADDGYLYPMFKKAMGCKYRISDMSYVISTSKGKKEIEFSVFLELGDTDNSNFSDSFLEVFNFSDKIKCEYLLQDPNLGVFYTNDKNKKFIPWSHVLCIWKNSEAEMDYYPIEKAKDLWFTLSIYFPDIITKDCKSKSIYELYDLIEEEANEREKKDGFGLEMYPILMKGEK